MFFGMECILDTFPSITVPLNEMNNGVCHLMCLFFVYAGRLHRWGLIVYRDIFLWWPDKFFAHFWCRSPGTLWGLKLEIPSHLSLTRTQRSVGRFSIFAAGRGRDFARQSSPESTRNIDVFLVCHLRSPLCLHNIRVRGRWISTKVSFTLVTALWSKWKWSRLRPLHAQRRNAVLPSS